MDSLSDDMDDVSKRLVSIVLQFVPGATVKTVSLSSPGMKSIKFSKLGADVHHTRLLCALNKVTAVDFKQSYENSNPLYHVTYSINGKGGYTKTVKTVCQGVAFLVAVASLVTVWTPALLTWLHAKID
jgi:hypothetical protein